MYRPPESQPEPPKSLQLKSDIYSFGLLLLEMLRGKPISALWSEEHQNIDAHQWRHIQLACIKGMKPSLQHLEPGWKKLIEDCLELDPNARPDASTLHSRLCALHLPPDGIPKFVFRLLRTTEAPNQDLKAQNQHSSVAPVVHVRQGSRIPTDRLSFSSDLEWILWYWCKTNLENNDKRHQVVGIDTAQLDAAAFLDASTQEKARNALNTDDALACAFAADAQEFIATRTVPKDAVVECYDLNKSEDARAIQSHTRRFLVETIKGKQKVLNFQTWRKSARNKAGLITPEKLKKIWRDASDRYAIVRSSSVDQMPVDAKEAFSSAMQDVSMVAPEPPAIPAGSAEKKALSAFSKEIKEPLQTGKKRSRSTVQGQNSFKEKLKQLKDAVDQKDYSQLTHDNLLQVRAYSAFARLYKTVACTCFACSVRSRSAARFSFRFCGVTTVCVLLASCSVGRFRSRATNRGDAKQITMQVWPCQFVDGHFEERGISGRSPQCGQDVAEVSKATDARCTERR